MVLINSSIKNGKYFVEGENKFADIYRQSLFLPVYGIFLESWHLQFINIILKYEIHSSFQEIWIKLVQCISFWNTQRETVEFMNIYLEPKFILIRA